MQRLYLAGGIPLSVSLRALIAGETPTAMTFLRRLFAELLVDVSYGEQTLETLEQGVHTSQGWSGTPSAGYRWIRQTTAEQPDQVEEYVETYGIAELELGWDFSWLRSGYLYQFVHRQLEVSFQDEATQERFGAIWQQVFGATPTFTAEPPAE